MRQAASSSSVVWNCFRLQALAQDALQAWASSIAASARAFCTIERMVRAQRPHFGLQPRQA